MANPFRRKDVAKAFFDLSIFDTEPLTIGKKPRQPHRDPSSQPSIITRFEPEQKPTLLTLPAEIRLQVYELLLVSWCNREDNPSSAVGNTCQKKVFPGIIRNGSMKPAILQTCKQLHHEAILILYSRNLFYISSPDEMFAFIAQIGPTNVKCIKSLEVWVPCRSEILPWLRLLETLSVKVTGLRFVEIAWDADCEFPWQLVRGAKERGLGDNVLFVRALARIQGLEKLIIGGYYGKHWPSYLSQEMSVQLRAECGHPFKYAGPEEQHETWVLELIEKNLQSFEKYQKGTEDLMP